LVVSERIECGGEFDIDQYRIENYYTELSVSR